MPPFPKAAQAALCMILCSTAALAAEPDAQVTGVNHFGHIVGNLDKSFAFYKDLLQLDVDTAPRAFDRNPAIMKMGNTLGAQSRIGVLKVPGAGFGLELIEYKDINRRPAMLRNQDPGTGNLILMVRDIDATLVRLKKGGAKIVTPGGTALDIGNKTRGAFAQDPDGFFVALVQRDPLPKSTAPETSNVMGGLIALTAGDADQTVRLYREVLGFKQLTQFPYMGDANRMAIGNTPGAQYRSTVLQILGTQVSVEFPQFKELEVRDVDDTLKRLKAACATVVTVGGEPVDVKISTGAILRNVIVRDPNNLYLELIQRML